MRTLPLLALVLIVSCSGGGGGGGGQEEQAPPTTGGTETGGTETGGTSGGTTGGTTGGTSGGSADFDVTLDSALTSSERSTTLQSIELLESLRINGGQIKGFSEVFGGNSSSSVVNYLEQRVNYIFSEVTDYRDRLVSNTPDPFVKFAYFGRNQSRDIWYTSVINEPADVRIVINNNRVDIPSSRIGVVNLGDIFTQSDTITQAITIVHEARHSDCPDGAKASEIQRWFDGLPPIDRSCGQLHGSCGGNSCDIFAWGPYAIDFIYSFAIANACTSCSETQKQQAQVNANAVQGLAFDIVGTVNGAYGRPDMSNSNTVRDDL